MLKWGYFSTLQTILSACVLVSLCACIQHIHSLCACVIIVFSASNLFAKIMCSAWIKLQILYLFSSNLLWFVCYSYVQNSSVLLLGLPWNPLPVSRRMNPKDFCDPLTFHLAPPTGRNFTSARRRGTNFCTNAHVSHGMICIPVGDPFHLAPPTGKNVIWASPWHEHQPQLYILWCTILLITNSSMLTC